MSKFRQSSGRISRSSFKIESSGRKYRNQGFGCETAQYERGNPEILIGKGKFVRMKLNTLTDTSFRKVSANTKRTTEKFNCSRLNRKVRGGNKIERD